ncbi:MAG: trypsin-like peptidase domain-containing protein [Candidatus Nitrosotenuis sp.]
MKWTSYISMFLVCFGGVLGALLVYDQIRPSSKQTTLQNVIDTKPVTYEPLPGQMDFADVADKILPAIVSVYKLESSFFRGAQPEVSGQGSGVVVTSDGYIVTNQHVIGGADDIVIRTREGKQFRAKLVGQDPIADLALLKVDGKTLPYAELGDSEAVRIGEWVIAVGSPLGFESTLSVGVVSALNRDLEAGPGSAPLVGAIQTDAAINLGNSGGALANLHGQVIGINTQIASPNRGSVGIGFAIPASRVRRFIDDIQKFGRARHPDLGVYRFGPSWWLSHPAFAEQVGANPPQVGLPIGEVKSGSPLDKAGLGRFDVLIELDGTTLNSVNDYLRFLLKAEIGQMVSVKYWQKGETKTVKVQLTEMQQVKTESPF